IEPSGSEAVEEKVTAWPVTGAAGDTLKPAAGGVFEETSHCAGDARSPQATMLPVSPLATSTTFSVHVPCSCLPSNALSRAAGLKEPVYGAAPAESGAAASSSNTVLGMLLSPFR